LDVRAAAPQFGDALFFSGRRAVGSGTYSRRRLTDDVCTE